LRLPSPRVRPAAPDQALTFAVTPLATGGGPWTWINALALDSEGPPAVLMAQEHEVRIVDGPVLRFPGGPGALPPGQDSIVGLDGNGDFKMGTACVRAGGL